MNGVLYVVKAGCQWHFLPKDFPPFKTVYSFYKRARDKGVMEKMMKSLVEKSRLTSGRLAKPSYSLIDSQPVIFGSYPNRSLSPGQ